MPWPWDFDSMAVARTLVQASRDAAAWGLRDRLASWLSEDPENWPLVRLTLIAQVGTNRRMHGSDAVNERRASP
jgi:hypothetical protein